MWRAILSQSNRTTSRRAFTIVELLVVIAVIGILAAIIIVSYNAVISRSHEASLKSDLQQASLVLEADVFREGAYPDTEAEANAGDGLVKSPSTTFSYLRTDDGYCLTGISDYLGVPTFYLQNGGAIQEGDCGDVLDIDPPVFSQGSTFTETYDVHTCGSTAISEDLAATGTAPITYDITNGSLPDGLELNAATGLITGSVDPDDVDSYAFDLVALNPGGPTSLHVSLTVQVGVCP